MSNAEGEGADLRAGERGGLSVAQPAVPYSVPAARSRVTADLECPSQQRTAGGGGKAKQAQATRAWQRAGLASKHVVSVSGAWHKNVRAAPGGDTSASGPWLPPVLLPGVSDRLPGPQT